MENFTPNTDNHSEIPLNNLLQGISDNSELVTQITQIHSIYIAGHITKDELHIRIRNLLNHIQKDIDQAHDNLEKIFPAPDTDVHYSSYTDMNTQEISSHLIGDSKYPGGAAR